MIYKQQWGPARHAANAAFIALQAAKSGINKAANIQFAKSQVRSNNIIVSTQVNNFLGGLLKRRKSSKSMFHCRFCQQLSGKASSSVIFMSGSWSM